MGGKRERKGCKEAIHTVNRKANAARKQHAGRCHVKEQLVQDDSHENQSNESEVKICTSCLDKRLLIELWVQTLAVCGFAFWAQVSTPLSEDHSSSLSHP